MLTKLEKSELASVIVAAKERTGAEIAVLIVKVSDSYLGLTIDLLAAVLFADAVLAYFGFAAAKPWLLALPWLVFAIAVLTPCRYALVGLLPQHLRYRRAAHQAVVAFHHFDHQAEAGTPAIMLYVSLAERYTHILHSRSLSTEIQNEFWQSRIKAFASTIKVSGLKTACTEAIKAIADKLPQQKIIGD